MRFFYIHLIALSATDALSPFKNITLQRLDYHEVNDFNFIRNNNAITLYSKFDESKFDNIAKSYAKQVEVEIVNGPIFKEDLTIPISNCLISTKGSGGSIGYSGAFSVTSSASISPALTEPILNAINFSGQLKIGKTLGTTLSYSCTASAGGVAQLQLTPIYVSFEYRTRESYFNILRGDKVESATSWSEVKAGSMPVIQTPIFHCVNGTAAICGIPPTNVTLPSNF